MRGLSLASRSKASGSRIRFRRQCSRHRISPASQSSVTALPARPHIGRNSRSAGNSCRNAAPSKSSTVCGRQPRKKFGFQARSFLRAASFNSLPRFDRWKIVLQFLVDLYQVWFRRMPFAVSHRSISFPQKSIVGLFVCSSAKNTRISQRPPPRRACHSV